MAGKFGIGARVRDLGGDEGVIVDKRKGERLVKYDFELYGTLWTPKDSLTVVPFALEYGKCYVVRRASPGHISTVVDDLGSTTNGWGDHNFELAPPEAGDRPAMLTRQGIERLLAPGGHDNLYFSFTWASTLQGVEFWSEQADHGLSPEGRAVLTAWLATPTPELPVGTPVTITGKVSGIYAGGVNVLVDGIPAATASRAFPATALRAA